MKQIYNVAIVGGGASGLICALECVLGKNALLGESVVVLEKNDRVGKKLISTGNGQGNFTNKSINESNYYGDPFFIQTFLEHQKNIDLDEYFYSLGIPFYTSADGKKYPLSRQANSVLDAFRNVLEHKKVQTLTNFCVENIIEKNGLFEISSTSNKIFAKNVVVAVGGSAGKHFGTDGTSYKLLTALGHEKTKLYPSLVQLKTQTEHIKALRGLKEQARVTAYDNGEKLKSCVGEILFTEYGVSGPAVFQVSGHLSKANSPWINVEFLPDKSKEETYDLLADKLKNLPFIPAEEWLNGILVKRVGQAVVKRAKSRSIEDIVYSLKNFSLTVTGNLGFQYAQVTKGGIKTREINPKTYESLIVKNMFVTGEVLDVDGDCGGYNLTFAFVSGIVSARTIKNNLQGE